MHFFRERWSHGVCRRRTAPLSRHAHCGEDLSDDVDEAAVDGFKVVESVVGCLGTGVFLICGDWEEEVWRGGAPADAVGPRAVLDGSRATV